VATIFNYTLENQIAKFSAVKSVVIACLEIGVLGPLYFIVYATVSENIVFLLKHAAVAHGQVYVVHKIILSLTLSWTQNYCVRCAACL